MNPVPGHDDPLRRRAALRREARGRRRALDPALRRGAQDATLRHFVRVMRLQPARRIAGYLAGPDEFDPAPLMAAAHDQGARLFVPRLSRVHPAGMGFAPLAPPLRHNRYGLLEPVAAPCISLLQMDLVLVPLVAFDARGFRLGMGGGFYDRALAYRRRRQHWRGPLLLGLAFGTQQVDRIPELPWDVRLDAILTENGWLKSAEDRI
ncbi:MAG: 5-formyltetrahydrofolate cyclo-ligase [Steroidobacteraceae bacterium]